MNVQEVYTKVKKIAEHRINHLIKCHVLTEEQCAAFMRLKFQMWWLEYKEASDELKTAKKILAHENELQMLIPSEESKNYSKILDTVNAVLSWSYNTIKEYANRKTTN